MALNKSFKLLLIIFLILFSVGSFFAHQIRAPQRNYSDFHCFYTAGKRILNHKNIYVIKDRETSEFRYAPIFALMMSGLALMNERKADTAWYLINYFLFILALFYLKKLVTLQEIGSKSVFILYLVSIIGVIRIAFHNLNSGQSNILMFASMVIGLYYIHKKRELLGAIIFAFSIMVKYTPLIFIPYFLLRKKFKLSLYIISAFFVYLFLPSLFIGLKTNLEYIKGLIPFLANSTILDQITILTGKNQSLLSAVYRSFTPCILYFHAPPMPFQSWNVNPAVIKILFTASALILYLLVLIPVKKINLNKHAPMYYNIDCALMMTCAALFNMNAWVHAFILLSMAYFVIVYHLIRNNFKDRIVFFLLIVSYILNLFTTQAILGKTLMYKAYFYSPMTLSALLTFIALLKIKFSTPLKEGFR
ncbi:MAG: glycosyltransferase family 87 protein [Candidatus Omnitrophota bacterium]